MEGVRGGVSKEAQPISEDDTHNEEYSGCVILIIPLTPPCNLMLFDSAQQPWCSVCMYICVCAMVAYVYESASKQSHNVCHICLS